VVGESGSGKSVTMLAVGDLVESPAVVSYSRLEISGHNLASASPRERRALLAGNLSYIFQDPGSSLNPAMRIGKQMIEGLASKNVPKAKALAAAGDRLADVHISSPTQRLRQYPHELSGGMKQRVMIATALLGNPSVIIADEPTTALDVTVQDQVLSLLREMNAEWGTAIVLVSHNLAVVAETCSRVIVMYAGRVVEDGSTEQVIHSPQHPYTKALLGAIPDLDSDPDRPLVAIPGSLPDPGSRLPGCPFADRCPAAFDRCKVEEPPLEGDGARAACWLVHG